MKFLPLIDGDWLQYLSCQAVEYHWEDRCVEDGLDIEANPHPPFQQIADVFDYKIKDIKKEIKQKIEECTEVLEPIVFFTGPNNFRKELAKTKEYKGNRKDLEKPYHHKNLKNYVMAQYHTEENDKIEADDFMAITQEAYERIRKNNPDSCNPKTTIIVTVDKDLRQVNGWHYSPEIGNGAASFGPKFCTDETSYVEFKNPDKIEKGLIGTGFKFFYAQCITGDGVDNIPGLPRHGPKAALKILEGCETERECFEAVRDAYRDTLLLADECLLEQARLLWMVRSLDANLKPKIWEEPDEER